jgi:hypothetical protein
MYKLEPQKLTGHDEELVACHIRVLVETFLLLRVKPTM